MSAKTESWLQSITGQLTREGFEISENVQFQGRTYRMVARRCRWEFLKFGFCEYTYVFAEFMMADKAAMAQFSASAYTHAKATRKVALPCGLFNSVWCYSVAMDNAPNAETLHSVRNGTPPKHWASAEVPVIYDAMTGKVNFFEKTPIWGAAYYRGFRKQIQQMLMGGATA